MGNAWRSIDELEGLRDQELNEYIDWANSTGYRNRDIGTFDKAMEIRNQRDGVTKAAEDARRKEFFESTDPSKVGMNVNAGLKDAQGRMKQPEFGSLLGSDGLIKDQWRLKAQPLAQYNSDWLKSAKAKGMSADQSPWAKLQMQKLGMQKADANDEASSAAVKGRADVSSSQGNQFKASQGARERVAMASPSAYDGVQSQYASGVGQVGAQDQTRKQGLLKLAAQGANSQAGADLNNNEYLSKIQKYNIDNSLADIQARRSTDSQNYNENMKAWAAAMQADATASSKPSGKK
jgi:hypothetical protein